MSTFKDFYKSPALLRILLLLYKERKSNPTKLANKLKITPTAVVSQLKFLEAKHYVKSLQEGRLQIYEPDIKAVTDDCLKFQKYLIIRISQHVAKDEKIEEEYFQPSYINKTFSDVRQNTQLIKLMGNWFKNFSEIYEFYERYYKQIDFMQIFLDIIPKDFAIHYRNFKKYIDENLLSYFHLLLIFQINITTAGKEAFRETFQK